MEVKDQVVVYENLSYRIVVGLSPKLPEFPEPFNIYLIFNRRYGVMEYYHQVLPYAIDWADQFDAHLRNVAPDPQRIVDPQAAFKFSPPGGKAN